MVNTNLNKISGWIILDKQTGVTSRQLVSKISKTLKIKKIGHGGTLDPMATGILPIALGEATKLISFVQNKKKKYSFTIKWGEATDTDDIEGKVIEKSDFRPNKKEITNALFSFVGKINQKPPIFSAIKVNGKRSYNLARKNIPIIHEPRPIEVYDEPTANLDAMNAELISNILFERSKKKIIITATHESMLLNRSSKIIKLS